MAKVGRIQSLYGGKSMCNDTVIDTCALFIDLRRSEEKVLQIQNKLYKQIRKDKTKKFYDLFNLVCHPA